MDRSDSHSRNYHKQTGSNSSTSKSSRWNQDERPSHGPSSGEHNAYKSNAGNYDNNRGSSDQHYNPANSRPPSYQQYRREESRSDRPYEQRSSHSTKYREPIEKYSENYSIQNDTCFISNIPLDITEEHIGQEFGSVGMLKIDTKTYKPKIWLYRDKVTQVSKGEATVTFEDNDSAQAAINLLNNKLMFGVKIKVELARRKTDNIRKPRNAYGGDSSDRRPYESRSFENRSFDNRGPKTDKNNWACSDCANINFGWRETCNRCPSKREDGKPVAEDSIPFPIRDSAKSSSFGEQYSDVSSRPSFNTDGKSRFSDSRSHEDRDRTRQTRRDKPY